MNTFYLISCQHCHHKAFFFSMTNLETESWPLLLLPHRRNTFSSLARSELHLPYFWKEISSGCLVHYYRGWRGRGGGGWVRVEKGGRRHGGPVDWKTLPPGRESVRGSIGAGANVATASLELWCKEHCVTPSASAQRVFRKRSHRTQWSKLKTTLSLISRDKSLNLGETLSPIRDWAPPIKHSLDRKRSFHGGKNTMYHSVTCRAFTACHNRSCWQVAHQWKETQREMDRKRKGGGGLRERKKERKADRLKLPSSPRQSRRWGHRGEEERERRTYAWSSAACQPNHSITRVFKLTWCMLCIVVDLHKCSPADSVLPAWDVTPRALWHLAPLESIMFFFCSKRFWLMIEKFCLFHITSQPDHYYNVKQD